MKDRFDTVHPNDSWFFNDEESVEETKEMSDAEQLKERIRTLETQIVKSQTLVKLELHTMNALYIEIDRLKDLLEEIERSET